MIKLKNIAFGNVHDLLDGDGGLKDVADWSQAARDAFRVVSIRQTLKGRKNGKAQRGDYVLKIKSEDKLKALELLGEHLGMFPHKQRGSKR